MIDLVSPATPQVRALLRQLAVLRQAREIFEFYDDRHLVLAVTHHIAALEQDTSSPERWPVAQKTARFRSPQSYWAVGFTRTPESWAIQLGRWTYVRTAHA